MFIQILLLIIGFILLIKGADIFVDGASSTAQNFKVSKMLIGLTIVAFGTSAPELAVSLKALSVGSTDMVLGNVIGSNITNGLLILGVAAIIRGITVKQNTVKKELPLQLLISALLVVLFLDKELNGIGPNMISRSDAMAILLVFSIFLYYIISISRHKIDEDSEPGKYGLVKSLLFVALGLIGIIFGSDLVVNSATKIATTLGVSERVISLTIIAFGTSLPELVTAIISSLKKEQDILVGNIIGSNIFNICIVLSLPVAIYGNLIPSSFEVLDLITIIGMSILLYIFAKTNNYKITKTNGIILILLYLAYYTAVFIM
ncbi:MAG: calcium/sodium antiporter [Erysipelotrichaceae bacterium]|nr:calcium/sodium antiporter [Erysipelotrichaceae bacterium]